MERIKRSHVRITIHNNEHLLNEIMHNRNKINDIVDWINEKDKKDKDNRDALIALIRMIREVENNTRHICLNQELSPNDGRPIINRSNI